MRPTLFALLVASTFATLASAQDFDFSTSEAIDEATLRGHIRFLADDSLEGRGPGSRGDDVTQAYLSTQFEMLGLAPGAADGSWKQNVPLLGVSTQPPATVDFVSGSQTVTLKSVDDIMTSIGQPIEKVSIEDAELVFVGYGITAPQYQWDDFKGVDLKSKILVMMNNDPADDPQLFEGKRRLYYGRWDYKYESAALQGAAGAIIIHTDSSAGYPWQVIQTSWSGEEFELRGIESPRMKMRGWATEDSIKKLCEAGGQNLDTLRAFAEKRDFRPVPLGVRMSLELTAKVREQDTANVYGVLEGSDPKLRDEYVIFMAHHDHLGIGPRDDKGDAIYNGAVDNAAGVACLLAIAKAYAEADSAPRRSVLFAAVAAEEQGLLGSKYMAAHPPVPPGRMAALVNMDGTNTLGRTRDVNVVGHGKSNLDALVQRVATAQGRDVTPDLFPDKGYYYRSDQFSLAKIGVPAVYLHAGVVVRDRPEGWGKEQQSIWVEKVYHQPSDQYDPNWDMTGAVEDTRLLFHVGDIAANNDEMPQWNLGDEFESARKAALAAVATPNADASPKPDAKEEAKPEDASAAEPATEGATTE